MAAGAASRLLALPEVAPLEAVLTGVNDVPILLTAYRVEAEAESDHFVQGPFLPDLQGAKINVGKKTTILDFDALPRITGNNYRQALAQAPGLLLSEETSPLLSIGYRGLEPHRAQFTQVLADGIPIHADQFGYPEAYYTPPLDTVDRIEFTRGGAGLMYGPQPGGALNYVTHRPRTDRAFSGETLHTFGSNDYYSTFNYLDGTVGRLGYYGYYNHRQSDGIRHANSDYRLDAWLGRVVLDATSGSRLMLTLETYEEEHGEPGGLTFATGPNAVNYLADRRASSRLFDRFNLDRKAASLIWDHDFDRGTLSMRAWAMDYVRASRRQGGGGFGTLPTGSAAGTNTIERQQFTTYGLDARFRFDWGADHRHVLTVGGQYFDTDSPRTDSRGATPDATNGAILTKSQRNITGIPVFVENLFRLDRLSITPGIRIETIRQDVRELVNVARTNAGRPLAARDDTQTVPLLGLAVAYELESFGAGSQVYFNLSESYRPMIFTQAVPNGANTLVNDDLEESRALSTELGWRGQPVTGLTLDASLFHLEFDNQIGNLALPGGLSTVANVGRAVHRGVEASLRYDVLAARFAGRRARPEPSLEFYANALLLDAEFKEGPNRGRTPQYAPDHLVRVGVLYTKAADLKVALTGTLTADTYADDAGTASRYIPSHAVWDFTVEARVPGSALRVIAGINNVFDEDYYSRVRNDGIDPAPRRNYYVGCALAF
jgi:Fe(3+) dicitrate transport protein